MVGNYGLYIIITFEDNYPSMVIPRTPTLLRKYYNTGYYLLIIITEYQVYIPVSIEKEGFEGNLGSLVRRVSKGTLVPL